MFTEDSVMFFWGEGGQRYFVSEGGEEFSLGGIRFSLFPNISEKKISPAAGLNQ